MSMPVFELRKLSGKRVALIPADMVLAVWADTPDRLILTTVDEQAYRFKTLLLHMTREDELPEYSI